MKIIGVLTTTALAGHMMLTGALAAPLPGSGLTAPGRDGLVRVQALHPEAVQDRMARVWQHRDILQNALQPPGSVAPDAPPLPQARALQRPEPTIMAAPQDPPLAEGVAGESQVTCEAAAQIVARFGFSDVGSPDCSGDPYRFSAMRDGTAYEIGISAATGEVAEVSRQ